MTAYLLLATLLVALIVSVVATAIRDRSEAEEENGVPTPEARQEEALEALRELEFDYETGVVTEEEYHRRRPVLAREAVEAHRETEAAGGPRGAPAPGALRTAAARDGAGRASPPMGREEGAAGAAGAAAGSEKTATRHCTSCGAIVRAGARFCPKCGTPVSVPGGGAAAGDA